MQLPSSGCGCRLLCSLLPLSGHPYAIEWKLGGSKRLESVAVADRVKLVWSWLLLWSVGVGRSLPSNVEVLPCVASPEHFPHLFFSACPSVCKKRGQTPVDSLTLPLSDCRGKSWAKIVPHLIEELLFA